MEGNPDPLLDSTTPENIEKREKNNNEHDGPPSVVSEPLRRFFVTTNSVMKTPLFRRLDQELRERREAMLHEKGWKVTEDERQKYS